MDALLPGGDEGDLVAGVVPLGVRSHIQDLLDLDDDHLGVTIARVQDLQAHTVDHILVGRTIEVGHYSTLLVVQIVKGLLNGVRGTPDWVAT